ncbi:alpha/beta hydrolase [Tenacibaculum amylolyticum]|uniref:alpha/beta hydrolase n=1 Tax=Tenacibaculum amylolyticum TaxID=104269 RepID=UPI003895ED38
MNVRSLLALCICLFQLTLKAQTKLAGSYGLDSDVQEFLNAIHSYTGSPLQDLPLDIGRDAMEGMQQDTTEIYNAVTFKKEVFKLQEKSVNVVLVKPKKYKGLLPTFIYFHGGGWVYNSFETHKRLMRDIAIKANVGIVFVEYSRAPEAKFPVANEEGYLSALYVSKYGKKYGLNPNKISIGGDSAGGNMTAVIALMTKERKEFKLNAQVLINPVTNTNVNTKSYEQFSKGHYLSRDIMIWFWKQYAPDKSMHSSSKIAPLKATKTELSGLPETLIITAEYDVLRDEGEAYAKKLRMAKVPVVSTRYGGTIHDFVVLNALKKTPPSIAAVAQICNFLTETFKAPNYQKND